MGKTKAKKIKLLPHEESLLASGDLEEHTHAGSTSRWLWAPSLVLLPRSKNGDECYTPPLFRHDDEATRNTNVPSPTPLSEEEYTLVYRPMGDKELLYLLGHKRLPDTQPYQAIIEGNVGRIYAEKFLRGHKKVNTSPTAVVEFCVPQKLVDTLMAMQHKVEDGAISMGLGNKAGNGLSLFNDALSAPPCGFRIVLVKRSGK